MPKGSAERSSVAEEDPPCRGQLLPPGKEEKRSGEAEEKEKKKSCSF